MLAVIYEQQASKRPTSGNHILAQFDDKSIIVYQAFNEQIAAAALKNQNFHASECIDAGFKFNRMSWIKTNFLWMMYRSGWATKKNQEKILAIRIIREGFDSILNLAVETNEGNHKFDQVRLQWDPDHNLDYSKVSTGRRAIQLGLRDDILRKFSNEFIISIEDITSFVSFNRNKVNNPSELMVPVEMVYLPKESETAKKIRLTII